MADTTIPNLANLVSVADGDLFTAVDVSDTSMSGSGTNVKVTAANLATYIGSKGLADHLADTSDAHDASAVSVADSGGLFAATDVEAALAEIAARGNTIVVDSSRMRAVLNTPSEGNVANIAHCWLLDQTTPEAVGFSVRFPDWTTMNWQAVWAPSDASATGGADGVRWELLRVAIADGAVPSSSGNAMTSTASAVTNQVVFSTAQSINAAGGTYAGYRLRRDATHAGDTYAADAKLLAVIFTRTA